MGCAVGIDYCPFGMQMPGRSGSTGEYRYAFNGMEKDDEIKGEGNSLDFGARIYDPRVGRWLSRDKMEGKKPYLSPYQSFQNNPIMYVDPDGNDEYLSYVITDEKTGKTTRIDVLNAHSAKVMTDGTGSSEVHSNNYYDFRTVTHITKHEDGTYSVADVSYEILYYDGDGLKDFDLAWGSSNVKPKGHIKNEADGFMYGVNRGNETQSGGFRFTSSDGGVSTTKAVSENDVESRDIGDLLDALGTLKNGSLGKKQADQINDIVGMVEKFNEIVPIDGSGGEGSDKTGGGSNKPIPDANIIIWKYPKDNHYNAGDRPKATPEQMKRGDTVGGNPDKNIYPEK